MLTRRSAANSYRRITHDSLPECTRMKLGDHKAGWRLLWLISFEQSLPKMIKLTQQNLLHHNWNVSLSCQQMNKFIWKYEKKKSDIFTITILPNVYDVVAKAKFWIIEAQTSNILGYFKASDFENSSLIQVFSRPSWYAMIRWISRNSLTKRK